MRISQKSYLDLEEAAADTGLGVGEINGSVDVK